MISKLVREFNLPEICYIYLDSIFEMEDFKGLDNSTQLKRIDDMVCPVACPRRGDTLVTLKRYQCTPKDDQTLGIMMDARYDNIQNVLIVRDIWCAY